MDLEKPQNQTKTPHRTGIRVRKDLKAFSAGNDTETSSSREIIEIGDDTNDSSSVHNFNEELPPNLSFVGVINCRETRLYPSPTLPTLKNTAPPKLASLKQYNRKVEIQPKKQESLLKVLPPLTQCVPKINGRNDIPMTSLLPMPRLKRKPNDGDDYEIEYLEETNEDEDDIGNKLSLKLRNIVKTQNMKKRIMMYRKHLEHRMKKNPSKVSQKKNNFIVIVDQQKRRSLRQARIKRELEYRRVTEEKKCLNTEVPLKVRSVVKVQSEAKKNKPTLPFHEFTDMLKMVLPNSWSVSTNGKSIHMFRTDYTSNNIPKISIGVMLSDNHFQVHVNETILKTDHPMWKNLSEPMSFNGNIRFAFILQLLAWLHPQRVCVKALENKDVDRCELLARAPFRFCTQCHPQTLSAPPTAPAQLTKPNIISLPLKTVTKSAPPQAEKQDGDAGVDKLFSAIKSKLEKQITRFGVEKELEKVPETQEEVLASMGLQRRDSVEKKELRKSKRERKWTASSLGEGKERQDELRFLITHWDAVTKLFTENLSFGVYANLERSVLLQSFKSTSSILRRWHLLSAHPFLTDVAVSSPDSDERSNMSEVELRAELCNNVREINRLKRKFKSICPLFSRLLRNELEMKPKEADLKM